MTQLPKIELGDFHFSSITLQGFWDKINFQNLMLIRELVNSKLKLCDYGGGVKKIAYIFVAVSDNNTMHDETLRYYKSQQEVFIQKKLPYDLVEMYDSEQVLHLMAATYLSSLEQLAKRKIPDFDGAGLIADVRTLFAEQGWMEPVENAALSPA